MTDIPVTAEALIGTPAVRGESRWQIVWRNAFPFLVVGGLWEIVAHLGVFPPRLFPPLEEVAATFVRLTAEGILPHHVFDTLLRLIAGFVLAAIAGVAIGFAMGRSRRAEDILLPLVSIGAPIPGFAYAPLFLLWFGLGNKSTILLVGFVSAFPIIFNTWTGVKAVKEIWVRSAQAMGADQRRLFRHVILPGALALRADRTASRPGAGVAHPGRRGDARGGALGAGLDDLRRARVPQHRRDAGRHFRDRLDRARAREARFPEARAVHRPALGDDDVNGAAIISDRTRSAVRAGVTLLVAAAAYEAVARTGYFPPALMPTLPNVWTALIDLLLDGSMIGNAAGTMFRVLTGLALAIVIGLPLGILMARFKPVENFVLPLASALMPIPSLAWAPLFILWFNLGNTVAILIVFYAALFPMLLNTWTGVRAVNPLWLRAAGAMGADERALFWKVIIPGASPLIITGLRQSFLRAWIAVIGAEFLAASDWGLGWVIFDAKEFLNTSLMLASLAVIGFIGFVFERLVFGSIERATVLRWGMVRAAKS